VGSRGSAKGSSRVERRLVSVIALVVVLLAKSVRVDGVASP